MKRVAMEYSPGAAIPYVGRVDAGTIEMVRAASGVEVVSSADLVQIFEARWTPEQKALHDRAARDTMLAKDEAFALIRERLRDGHRPSRRARCRPSSRPASTRAGCSRTTPASWP